MVAARTTRLVMFLSVVVYSCTYTPGDRITARRGEATLVLVLSDIV
jgi:hypothetical protein